MPAQTIRQLARDYANTKPAALIQGGDHSATTAASAPRAARPYWRPLPVMSASKAVGLRVTAAALTVNLPRSEMPDNPVKAKISVMNWVQAADDASKVTPDMGLKDADKLDSNIRILFSLAGNYLANQNPDSHQRYAYWRMNQRSSLLSPAICL